MSPAHIRRMSILNDKGKSMGQITIRDDNPNYVTEKDETKFHLLVPEDQAEKLVYQNDMLFCDPHARMTSCSESDFKVEELQSVKKSDNPYPAES